MKKTKFGSYYLNGIVEGCKHCVKGKKLVLFISGVCSRNCAYCSLSNLRKNKDNIWANERKSRKTREVIEEVLESRADSAGITGGDPLAKLNRTLRYANSLKKKFGKEFHIHIYLPTKLINEKNIKKLSGVIDEVRIHPEFLLNKDTEKEDIRKIMIIKRFFKKKNIGIELPILPNKKKEIIEFILKLEKDIGFVNLNELEVGENNLNFITKNYILKKNGYVVSNSKKVGLGILKELEKNKTKLKVHLCTADTKNQYQYANRMKLHKTLPFGKRTKEGNVIYFILKEKEICRQFPKETYWDKRKKRVIISLKLARKIRGKYKIERVEEFPTYDREEIEREFIE